MDGMTIGEVARRSGVRPSALRYYESVGVLPAPERVNGRRRYEGGVLEMLAVVRFARRAGFSIAEIRTFLHGFPEETPPSERWRWLAREKLPEVEAMIERALGTKRLLERGLACGCARLEDCVACP
jgi:MerR family transcriptional regulator, redox-sensitive transcriptional activator SoxR